MFSSMWSKLFQIYKNAHNFKCFICFSGRYAVLMIGIQPLQKYPTNLYKTKSGNFIRKYHAYLR